jgi:putative hemolysin
VQEQICNQPLAFEVIWARDEGDVREARQLRYGVFAEEMGARLTIPHGCPPRHDIDIFDPFCEHLLVRAKTSRDGGHVAASLWEHLRKTHLAAIEWQVQSRLALPAEELRRDLAVEAPALIKGYLRCGTKVLGPPAWDPDFNSADLLPLTCAGDSPSRCCNHFLSAIELSR